MSISVPKGTKDIWGDEVYLWQKIEKAIRETCEAFNIEEMRTPTFEYTELFQRGVGDTTDIVQKEMYTFLDKGGRSITLRPEGTAGIARSFIENGLYVKKLPAKLYYIGPMFRYENPQLGRQRQFHQFGVEYFGSEEAASDAEVISIGHSLIEKIGIKNVKIHINSLGGKECRINYNKTLKDFLSQNVDSLCSDCKERYEKNPLRVLDCKNENCQKVLEKAPLPLDTLSPECRKHFDTLTKILDSMGIEYVINKKIVRGLDYYSRTVFEFIAYDDEDKEMTILGGGRYDGLVKELGGPNTSGIGFAIGLERFVNFLKDSDSYKPNCQIYIGSIGESGLLKSQNLIYDLRKKGIIAEADIMGRGVKAQMKYADKIKSEYVLILGDDEINANKGKIKNMESGEQTEIFLDKIFEFIKGEK